MAEKTYPYSATQPINPEDHEGKSSADYNLPDYNIPRAYTADIYKKCYLCKKLHVKVFFSGSDICAFCALEQAHKKVRGLESLINSTVPPGRSIQEPCQKCQVLNWWTNLDKVRTDDGKNKFWCVACRGDQHQRDFYLQSNPVKRYTETGKMSNETLDNILKDLL